MSGNTTADVCFLNGKKYLDISEMKCFLSNITLFLYNFHLDYVCFALLLIIVIISLFGKIKEDYRWFILNQAVWDIGITYSYSQNGTIYEFYSTGRIITYYSYATKVYLEFLVDIIDTNPFSSLLLLSWSRFLALYFSNFYDRITAKKRVFVTIILFNLIIIFLHTSSLWERILLDTRKRLNQYCGRNDIAKDCVEWYKSQLLYIFLSVLYSIFRLLVLLKPIIFLCLSIFAAIMILAKIGKQAKFQLKHNRRDFFVSFRISIVILFQTVINSILVFVEFTESIDDVFLDVFGIRFEKHMLCKDVIADYWICWDFLQLPEWLEDEPRGLGLESPIIYPAFKQLRIFLESIIILSVMAGYREAIVRFCKYLYSFYKKPKSTSTINPRMFQSRASSGASPNAS